MKHLGALFLLPLSIQILALRMFSSRPRNNRSVARQW